MFLVFNGIKESNN